MRHLVATSAAAFLLAPISVMAQTTVYSNTFDAPPATSDGVVASGPTNGSLGTATVGPWNSAGWSGNFFTNSSSSMSVITLENLPVHTEVSVDFLLGFLDSWDSFNGSPSPDELSFFIDGVPFGTVLTADNASGSIEQYAGGTELFDGVHLNGNTTWTDALVNVSLQNLPHTASTFTFGIQAGGAGWQGGTDESWGIDNFRISVNSIGGAVPEPSTWAMMLLGFGFVGGAMRARQRQKSTLSYA